MADYKLWNALKDAKKYRWVELSHALNNESPYWSGIPEGSVELAKTVWDWGKPELECLIQTFKFPGQFGTHIDFPGHFIKGKALSEKYDVNDLIFPLVVIDISQQAKKDPRYAVTVEDIKAYEAKYGPIPDGALVALRSDWYKKWPDMDALSGIDAEGKENAPGWSLEALEYIYKVRNAAANGHETLDTDLLLLPFQIQSRSLPAAVPARMSAALPQKMPVPVQRMPVHLPGKAAAILP